MQASKAETSFAAVRRVARGLCLLLAAILLSGCLALAERVANHLAAKGGQGDSTFVMMSGDIARFRECLKERGGSCEGAVSTALPQATSGQGAVKPIDPQLDSSTRESLGKLPSHHPARQAEAVLSHSLVRKTAEVYNELRGHGIKDGKDIEGVSVTTSPTDGSRTVTLDTSVREVRDLLNQVHSATSSGSWESMARAATTNADALPGSQAMVRATRRDQRTFAYIRRYMAAYFQNGHFVEIDFTLDPVVAQQKLADDLCGAESPPVSICRQQAAKLFESFQALNDGAPRQIVRTAGTGFVSRDSSYSAMFPGFQIDIDPTSDQLVTFSYLGAQADRKEQYLTVGVDLLRVLLEAVFDAHEGLPAQSGATGLEVGDVSLPPFDPSTGNVDTEDFSAILVLNNRIEAATGVLVDRIIRGIGPLSINNEAVEQALVTIIATTVRKASEKATWCWYACDLNTQVENAVHKAESTVKLRLHLQ